MESGKEYFFKEGCNMKINKKKRLITFENISMKKEFRLALIKTLTIYSIDFFKLLHLTLKIALNLWKLTKNIKKDRLY